MPKQPPDPLYMTIQDAAIKLGVSEDTVRRRIADGTLPTLPLGKRKLIPVTALEMPA